MIVSFVLVAYNEGKTLRETLDNLINQDYPHDKIEVLLIDSMSTDNTADIMKEFAAEDHGFRNVMLLKNENKQIPYGCNVALDNYTGDAIVRVDAHVFFPKDFISKSVNVLREGEDIAGGQVVSVALNDTPFQNTLLIVENSTFCGSVAKFRHLTKREYVSTMAFGLYRREVFEKVGKYNVLLPRSEDNDMNYRVNKAGYKLCCDPGIVSTRHNRGSFKSLLRQKYLNGYWIGKTMGVSPKCYSLFHFVPFGFVMGIIITTLLCFFGFPYLSWLMWLMYILVDFAVSAREIIGKKFNVTNLLLPILFFIMHLGYGVGTLLGLIVMPFWLLKVKKQMHKEKEKEKAVV